MVDPVTFTKIADYTIGTSVEFGGPYGVAFDGTYMWFATGGHSVIRVAVAGAAQDEFTVGIAPRALTFDGTNIWVANFGSNDVTEIPAATGIPATTWIAGTNPAGIAFDGTNVWVANSGSNNASRM